MRTGIFMAWAAWLVSACAVNPSSNLAYPLFDGKCDEYSSLSAEKTSLNGVDIYIHQDAGYVWICYTYPEGSFGTLDMELQAPKLTTTLNLHVSVQVGEWPLGDKEAEPKNPESDLWWNNRGWMANPIWINGMDKSGVEPQYRFKNSPAREMQLSKARFGHGDWYLVLHINAIKNVDGEFERVTFPLEGSYHLLSN